MLAYWKLLMRDRLMALAPSGRRREGQAAWKAVLGWAGITLLAVSLFAMAVLFEMVMYDQAKAMGEPQAVIALAFLACTLMTLIYSFFYVISLLFFGRDCAFVGALPIPSHGVLLAKLATVLAGEIGLTALVCLPLLIRYGVETGPRRITMCARCWEPCSSRAFRWRLPRCCRLHSFASARCGSGARV